MGVTFGTMAYLTDTEAVTNTFTVGQVHISLDEADVDDTDKDGNTTERDKTNEYHLIPGQTYIKDPIVHVRADSESSWVFVKVENGISDIEAATEATATGYKSIADQISVNDWTPLDGVTNVFYKKWEKPTAAVDDDYYDLAVFQNFKVDGEKTVNVEEGKTAPAGKYDIADYGNAQIVVTAYAIQAAGFENNVSGAWAAFVDQNADLFR